MNLQNWEGVYSDSGTIAYVAEKKSVGILVWVDREGNEERLNAAPPNEYAYPKISPDGTKVALTVNDGGNENLFILDLDRETMPRLTNDGSMNRFPLWTLDGQRIVFTSNREGGYGIYLKAANDYGSGKVEKLASWSNFPGPFDWSKKGKTLLLWIYDHIIRQTSIEMMSMESGHDRKALLGGKVNYDHPQISPGWSMAGIFIQRVGPE